MQLVTAIIKPFQLENVKDALHAVGSTGVTVTDVTGHGRQRGHTEVYRGSEYTVDFVPKIRIEVLCEDSAVDSIMETIATAARTGKIGDGKIWVLPVGRAMRIRTGETDTDAI
jgi:nitrogen regulatory protein P-II 1